MDVEKTIEFLMDHHARFAADMEQMKERHEDLRNTVDRLQGIVANQQSQISQIVEIAEELARHQIELTDSQRALAESQRHTDGRLNALIKVGMTS